MTEFITGTGYKIYAAKRKRHIGPSVRFPASFVFKEITFNNDEWKYMWIITNLGSSLNLYRFCGGEGVADYIGMID